MSSFYSALTLPLDLMPPITQHITVNHEKANATNKCLFKPTPASSMFLETSNVFSYQKYCGVSWIQHVVRSFNYEYEIIKICQVEMSWIA